MSDQGSLFGEAPQRASDYPRGFRYRADLIDRSHERSLIEAFADLPFKEFEFHGYTGKRRVVSFGWRYDFSTRRVEKVDDIPAFLLPLRALAAEFAGLGAIELQHVLITEYTPGAAIGWHRDRGVFHIVVGISLLSACVFRLRRKAGERWERVNVRADPRSGYVLSGEARDEWEHSIPPVESLRYSVTLRSMREKRGSTL